MSDPVGGLSKSAASVSTGDAGAGNRFSLSSTVRSVLYSGGELSCLMYFSNVLSVVDDWFTSSAAAQRRCTLVSRMYSYTALVSALLVGTVLNSADEVVIINDLTFRTRISHAYNG